MPAFAQYMYQQAVPSQQFMQAAAAPQFQYMQGQRPVQYTSQMVPLRATLILINEWHAHFACERAYPMGDTVSVCITPFLGCLLVDVMRAQQYQQQAEAPAQAQGAPSQVLSVQSLCGPTDLTRCLPRTHLYRP